LVASESGGLFKSRNRGATWKHIDTLAPYFTNAVAFLPNDSKVVIGTTCEDFSKSNQGGIWRSADEGETWSPVLWLNPATGQPGPTPLSAPPGLSDQYSAFEISIAPDTHKIYVASSAGIEIGTPDGTTWSHHDLGVAAPEAFTVLALTEESPGAGNRVIAGGEAGIWRSTNGGVKWTLDKISIGCDKIKTDLGCVADMHALGASPVATKQAYVINGDMKLFFTTDAGLNWKPINSAPSGGEGCGGIAFIQVIGGTTSGGLDLYYSDRCNISKLTALPVSGTTNTFDYTGTWKKLSSDHGDTRHLAFDDNNAPLLLATDGGLHKTIDGGANWTFTGGGAGGYNALQIYQVKGQWIDNLGQHNLYFGTQDNSLWSSTDSGNTWVACACNEGDFFEAEYRIGPESDRQITMWNPWVNIKLLGTSFSAGIKAWTNPPGQINNDTRTGRPKIVRKDFHVQWVEEALGPTPSGKPLMEKGLAVNRDFGTTVSSWEQYARIKYDHLDLPRVSQAKKIGSILYQPIRGGFDAVANLEKGSLVRVTPSKNAPEASIHKPLMTSFGGYGIPPTMQNWYRVFAVDPRNPNHLLAPDVINKQMMESVDGGENWTAMTQLTSLVTNNDKLNFRGRIFFSQHIPGSDLLPISQVSAISFHPENPDRIALGTVQNGIFVSIDGGKNWKQVPGSEKATLISSLHWRTENEIIVSTYGRGLWRVTFKYVTSEFICRSPDCFHIFHQKPPKQPPSPFDLSVVAFGGHIRGVRARDTIVEEIFVQPGTTIAYAVNSLQAPTIRITETTAQAQSLGAIDLPRAPRRARIITGLTLREVQEGNELVGVLFSPRPLSMTTSASIELTVVRPEPAQTEREPSLELISGPEITPGRSIELKGRGLPAGTEAEIKIDDVTTQRVVADRNGNFAATLPSPARFGFHLVRLVVAGRVVDGAIIGVRPDH
jgi:photosystem II stability/assembly factor-like uncharacterized protein